MIIDFIWSVCRVIAFLLQFIGVMGLLIVMLCVIEGAINNDDGCTGEDS